MINSINRTVEKIESRLAVPIHITPPEELYLRYYERKERIELKVGILLVKPERTEKSSDDWPDYFFYRFDEAQQRWKLYLSILLEEKGKPLQRYRATLEATQAEFFSLVRASDDKDFWLE